MLGISGTLASTIGEINPLRYRGYYYDGETELYYLQSRYYSPELMRFISQDDAVLSNDQGEPLGSNLYAYCLNNPVNSSDPTGSFGTPIQWAMAIIGGIAGWYFGDYVAKKLGYKSGWKYWAIRAGVVVGGAVIGWFAGTAIKNIAIAFLKANPSVLSKIPGVVKWFLGLGSTALTPKSVADLITNANRVGSALPSDIYHRAASWLSKSQLAKGKVFYIKGNDGLQYILLQVKGTLNGKAGVFEYIVNKAGEVTHQLFKAGGIINGRPN